MAVAANAAKADAETFMMVVFSIAMIDSSRKVVVKGVTSAGGEFRQKFSSKQSGRAVWFPSKVKRRVLTDFVR